ncbi:hypothetical protein Plhal304r1_c024g0081951 [Plasmopara halstedii]
MLRYIFFNLLAPDEKYETPFVSNLLETYTSCQISVALLDREKYVRSTCQGFWGSPLILFRDILCRLGYDAAQKIQNTT